MKKLLPKTLAAKLDEWTSKGRSNMSNQPIIILDTANLLAGEHRQVGEAKQIIDRYLPMIDRCCLKSFGQVAKQKLAFSLTSIKPEIHSYLEAAGYEVELASPMMTQTMKMEKASKLDDYALHRQVKALVTQQGQREFLIVSGDRDFEGLAHQLSSYGTKFFYVQRQKQKQQTHMHFTRYGMLREFSEPLTPAEEQVLNDSRLIQIKEKQNKTEIYPTEHSSSPLNHILSEEETDQVPLNRQLNLGDSKAYFSVIYQDEQHQRVELFDNFKVGRASNRIGPVDLCVGEFDQNKQYSRKLAKVFKLGKSWVLWRPPLSVDKAEKQPIAVIQAHQTQSLGSGESIILSEGDQVQLTQCDLILEFHQ